jgi:hypothetical protein
MNVHSDTQLRRGPVARAVVFALAIALIAAPGLLAQSSGGGTGSSGGQQSSVSESELESFVAALQDVQSIRQDMADDTQQAVSDSPLEQQRFEELYRSQQGGQEPSQAPSNAESEQFQELMAQIQQIQQQSNEQMVEAVQDEGLSVQRFNQIAQAIQQDQQLQEQFREMHGGGSGS